MPDKTITVGTTESFKESPFGSIVTLSYLTQGWVLNLTRLPDTTNSLTAFLRHRYFKNQHEHEYEYEYEYEHEYEYEAHLWNVKKYKLSLGDTDNNTTSLAHFNILWEGDATVNNIKIASMGKRSRHFGTVNSGTVTNSGTDGFLINGRKLIIVQEALPISGVAAYRSSQEYEYEYESEGQLYLLANRQTNSFLGGVSCSSRDRLYRIPVLSEIDFTLGSPELINDHTTSQAFISGEILTHKDAQWHFRSDGLEAVCVRFVPNPNGGLSGVKHTMTIDPETGQVTYTEGTPEHISITNRTIYDSVITVEDDNNYDTFSNDVITNTSDSRTLFAVEYDSDGTTQLEAWLHYNIEQSISSTVTASVGNDPPPRQYESFSHDVARSYNNRVFLKIGDFFEYDLYRNIVSDSLSGQCLEKNVVSSDYRSVLSILLINIKEKLAILSGWVEGKNGLHLIDMTPEYEISESLMDVASIENEPVFSFQLATAGCSPPGLAPPPEDIHTDETTISGEASVIPIFSLSDIINSFAQSARRVLYADRDSAGSVAGEITSLTSSTYVPTGFEVTIVTSSNIYIDGRTLSEINTDLPRETGMIGSFVDIPFNAGVIPRLHRTV